MALADRHVRTRQSELIDDPRMPEAVVRRIYDARPGPERLWVGPGGDNVGAIALPDYCPHVRSFVEEHGR